MQLWLTQDFPFNRVQPTQSIWTRIKVHLDASLHIKSTSDDYILRGSVVLVSTDKVETWEF